MVTLCRKDNNFLKWQYQIEFFLEGYGLFGHFDGSTIAPQKFAVLDEEGVTSEVTTGYKEWLRTDKALMSFVIATLSDDTIEYVSDSKTTRDAWLSLSNPYAMMSHAQISHLKTELQKAKKGGDSINKFLLCLKHIKDQLSVAGISISNDDLMIVALNGLPSEYDMIKTVLIALDTSISFKEFHTQLLTAE
ncbi:unnamed protein product [Prunus armeniaca]